MSAKTSSDIIIIITVFVGFAVFSPGVHFLKELIMIV